MEDRSPPDETQAKGGPSNMKDGHYIDKNNDEVWVQDGKYHRLDGPAYLNNVCKFWYKNGELHREYGPAEIIIGAWEIWYQYDKKHRLDGPAVSWWDGTKEFWIDGVRYKDDLLWRLEVQRIKRKQKDTN